MNWKPAIAEFTMQDYFVTLTAFSGKWETLKVRAPSPEDACDWAQQQNPGYVQAEAVLYRGRA